MVELNVSIIVPVFNRKDILLNTLESIKQQTYKEFECIIVDDNSTDNLIEAFNSWDLGSQFKLINNSRSKGAQGARNSGLLASKGKFICFFDSDDIMKANHIEVLVNYLTHNHYVGAVTSCSHVLNDESKIIDAFTWSTIGDIFADLILQKTYVDTNAVMYRKETVKGIQWDENLVSNQELDFNLSIASKGIIFEKVWEFTVNYYRRTSDTISSDSFKDTEGVIFILVKWKEFYIEYLGKWRYYLRITSLHNWRNYYAVAKLRIKSTDNLLTFERLSLIFIDFIRKCKNINK